VLVQRNESVSEALLEYRIEHEHRFAVREHDEEEMPGESVAS
jgi:hypothetical protein